MIVAYQCRLCADPAVEGTAFCKRHQSIRQTRRPPRPYHGKYAPRGPRFGPTSSREWFALSRAFLADNPFCARCRLKGRTVMATVSDHVVPARLLHKRDPSLVFDRAWLQPLDSKCHGTKTMHERRGEAWDYRTNPATKIIIPRPPW